MKNFILECCVDSVESAVNAALGGADRLELCANLVIGGTTPSYVLFEQVKWKMEELGKQAGAGVKIHVLIRPRFGDFCYSPEEVQEMRREIEWFREQGADGVVIGALCPDGTLDMEVMKYLMEGAGKMHVTLHRAFDMTQDPLETLEKAAVLSVGTILTSGQQETATAGAELLATLQERAQGRLHLLAGGGVSAEVIGELYRKTGISHYHMSGKVTLDSLMTYRKDTVHMGLPGISEYEIWRTDREKVRRAREVLDSLAKDFKVTLPEEFLYEK